MKAKFILWFVNKFPHIKFKVMSWITSKLPATVLYYCFLEIVKHSTTGAYSDTELSSLRAMEALKRFKSDKGIK